MNYNSRTATLFSVLVAHATLTVAAVGFLLRILSPWLMDMRDTTAFYLGLLCWPVALVLVAWLALAGLAAFKALSRAPAPEQPQEKS